MGDLLFVTGGARSGKSWFAEQEARRDPAAVWYLATMVPGDAELEERVRTHRARRPPAWITAEAPVELLGTVRAAPSEATLLVDCLSLWVSNRLPATATEGEAAVAEYGAAVEGCLEEARDILAAQRARAGRMIAVSNEVGSGIVPLGALSRAFRDALGLVNQEFARAADEAVLMVSGLPVWLKPRPDDARG